LKIDEDIADELPTNDNILEEVRRRKF